MPIRCLRLTRWRGYILAMGHMQESPSRQVITISHHMLRHAMTADFVYAGFPRLVWRKINVIG